MDALRCLRRKKELADEEEEIRASLEKDSGFQRTAVSAVRKLKGLGSAAAIRKHIDNRTELEAIFITPILTEADAGRTDGRIAMAELRISFEPERAWPDLDRAKVVHLGNDAPPICLAVLDMGMASGLPSIMLRLDLPDGTHVLSELSARLYVTAAQAILAKYPRLLG